MLSSWRESNRLCVETVEFPRRLTLRQIGVNVIKDDAACAIAKVEKAYHDAQGGAFPVIRFQWHDVNSWLLTIRSPDAIEGPPRAACGRLRRTTLATNRYDIRPARNPSRWSAHACIILRRSASRCALL